MKIKLNCYPEGKKKALTLSYDDGARDDIRLVSLLNQYEIKGTFHLHSSALGMENRMAADELKRVFTNHEVAAHALTHPHLTSLIDSMIIEEIVEDRRNLEQAVGYIVRGMSYPYGSYNQRVIEILKSCGIEYARTTKSHGNFNLPDEFLEWHPTCHHNDRLIERYREFKNVGANRDLPLFYVWGHSFEFARENNWGLIEEFCKLAAHDRDIWYATNIEIKDYIDALRHLRMSIDQKMIQNVSSTDVWISVDEEVVQIKAGTTFQVE